MGLSVKGGSFNANTLTGNQSVTGVGFQPKLVIFYSIYSADRADATTVILGAATSSSARWCANYVHYNAEASANDPVRFHSTTKCFSYTFLSGGAVFSYAIADFVSMDSDGFTINWTVAPGASSSISYLCIGGTDISVKVGSFDTTASTGSKSVTGVGFQPTVVMPLLNGIPAEDGVGAKTVSNMTWGAVKDSTHKFAASASEIADSIGITNTSSVLRTDKFTAFSSPGEVYYSVMSFTSMDADGFTYSVDSIGGSDLRNLYIAFAGTAQFDVGVITQPNGTTGNQAKTGVGFQPAVEIFLSAGKANGAISQNSGFMFGAGVSSSDRGVMSSTTTDNTAPASNPFASTSGRAKVAQFEAGGSTTLLSAADMVSQDSDGFTVNWTTADAVQREIGYLAIAAAASGAAAAQNLMTLLGVGI